MKTCNLVTVFTNKETDQIKAGVYLLLAQSFFPYFTSRKLPYGIWTAAIV